MTRFKFLRFLALLSKVLYTAFWGESVKPSIDSIIGRLVKLRAGTVCHTWK